MKKYLLGIICICLFSLGCKKDQKKGTGPDTKLHSVSYNIGVSQTSAQFLGNSTGKPKVNDAVDPQPLGNLMDILYYNVYDASGKIVHSIVKHKADPDFALLKDNLVAGTYTIVFFGGYKTLYCGKNTLQYDVASYQGTTIPVDPVKFDTFYKKISLTVTNADSNQDITLDRIVAKLIINVEDAIPAGATKLTASISPVFKYLWVNGTVPTSPPVDSEIGYITLPLAVTGGSTNNSVSTLLYTAAIHFNVTLDCTDATGKSYAHKVIPDISTEPNKVTLLTGNLFGTTSTHGNAFHITINPDWNTTTIDIPYH